MWDNAEVVLLLDQQRRVCAISRNEDEAYIHEALGKHILSRVHQSCLEEATRIIDAAFAGQEVDGVVASVADDGHVFWSRVRAMRSPMEDTLVLVHARRLPQFWDLLTEREREVIDALHRTSLNPKRAAKELGISANTLNAHRRSITKKCRLRGIGDFWVFVERCR